MLAIIIKQLVYIGIYQCKQAKSNYNSKQYYKNYGYFVVIRNNYMHLGTPTAPGIEPTTP